MREIPSLQSLCLRVAGSQSCSVEATFSKTETGTPSLASRLLRSFHQRSDMERTPCIGPGSYRRFNTNDVDLNHPWIGCRNKDNVLVAEYGNPAIDLLQSYIDALVEMGRTGESRLGVHFFEEWRVNVVLAAKQETTVPLGPLSLHNCTVSTEVVEAMLESNVGAHLAVLDLTGVQGLTDDLLVQLLPHCQQLRRLSLKNCRRITVQALRTIAQHQAKLTCLDIGGSFNLTSDDVLEVVPTLTQLEELHASGIGWSNEAVQKLTEIREWTALSLGFSVHLTQSIFRSAFVNIATCLQSLALPFCESIIDNTAMGIMGRNLPNIRYLDVRGNVSLTTVTGWYDGRASADWPVQSLTLLARYSGLNESSVEETKRIHPVEAQDLVVILDGTGMGAGIQRQC